jgi:hypothetical protein
LAAYDCLCVDDGRHFVDGIAGLLGIGWNFLFLSGTNLLPSGYRPEERFRVQSANDFVVFSAQAMASLGSGWLLHHWQWQGIIYASIPLVFAFALLLVVNKNIN